MAPQTKQKKTWLLALLVVVVSSIVIFAFSRPGKTLYKVARLLSALNTQNTSFKMPKNIKLTTINYPDDGKSTQALIFQKGTQKQGAVIISGGVGLSKESTDLIDSFAANLANLGVTVMIPQTLPMQDDIVTESSVRSYVNAFKYLENQGNIEKNKIGFFGFCAGGSFVLLASEDPQISNQVATVNAFSPYNDLIDYYSEAFSHQAITQDGTRPWEPYYQTVDILTKNFTYRSESLALSNPLIASKINQILTVQDDAQSKKQEIENTLPSSMLAEAKQLSPDHAAANIKAKVYIIHDYNDTFTPREESERLAAEIGKKAELITPTIFDHTILQKDITPIQWIIQGLPIVNVFYKTLYNLS